MRQADVEAIDGVSAAPTNEPEKLRELIMAVPASYIWRDVRAREGRGLGGGGGGCALSQLRVTECS
eukprot:2952238-Pyramimonas_sp.AAC.1